MRCRFGVKIGDDLRIAQGAVRRHPCGKVGRQPPVRYPCRFELYFTVSGPARGAFDNELPVEETADVRCEQGRWARLERIGQAVSLVLFPYACLAFQQPVAADVDLQIRAPVVERSVTVDRCCQGGEAFDRQATDDQAAFRFACRQAGGQPAVGRPVEEFSFDIAWRVQPAERQFPVNPAREVVDPGRTGERDRGGRAKDGLAKVDAFKGKFADIDGDGEACTPGVVFLRLVRGQVGDDRVFRPETFNRQPAREQVPRRPV